MLIIFHMYVCMYVCTYVCMYVWLFILPTASITCKMRKIGLILSGVQLFLI